MGSKNIEAFLDVSRYAVAGASSNRAKYGNKCLRCLLQNERNVVAIHPSETEVEGVAAYKSVLAASEIESLSVVTPPAVTNTIVREAIEAGVKHIWMQPGAESQQAVDEAIAAGISVISGGPCLLVVLGYRESST